MIKESVEKTVPLPQGFQAEIDGNRVSIKGNGKEAERAFKANGITFEKEENGIKVVGKPASRKTNTLMYTIASHLNNMIKGLEQDYIYRLTAVYSHFPMNIAVKGNIVEINNFTGEKKARTAKIVPGATVTIKGKEVTVKSSSKEAAGQTAANIEGVAKVKGKDKRIFQDGIFIVEKGIQEKKESN